MSQNRQYLIFSLLLVLLYSVGIVGLSYEPTTNLFLDFIPFVLLLSTVLLFYFHKDWNKNFVLFAATTYCLGYLVEVLGVQTGFPFGHYHYGDAMGLKVFGVPLIIGVNWLMLVYASGILVYFRRLAKWMRAALGAFLMLLLDFLMEPVAVEYNFWQWSAPDIPFTNYLAWYVISLLLLLLFFKLKFKKTNKLAPVLYIVLLLFFTALNVV